MPEGDGNARHTGPIGRESPFVHGVAIRNCAPDPLKGAKWGDTYFAAALARAVERRGVRAHVHTRDEWDEARSRPYGVLVHLRGLFAAQPSESSANVLWLISHPDKVTDEELQAYDYVLVASASFAEEVRSRTSRPVRVFHQATDPTTFRPMRTARAKWVHGIAVVANARWPYRPGPRWLMDLGYHFSLFGTNWKSYPEHRFLVSDYVDNFEVAQIYSTADVVVADQWDTMSREGFVANRLFDVAASGGFVVSSAGPGVKEVFGDRIPTYASREELDHVLTKYLQDPEERSRLAYQAMTLVRHQHTFDRRVDELIDLVAPVGGR